MPQSGQDVMKWSARESALKSTKSKSMDKYFFLGALMKIRHNCSIISTSCTWPNVPYILTSLYWLTTEWKVLWKYLQVILGQELSNKFFSAWELSCKADILFSSWQNVGFLFFIGHVHVRRNMFGIYCIMLFKMWFTLVHVMVDICYAKESVLPHLSMSFVAASRALC